MGGAFGLYAVVFLALFKGVTQPCFACRLLVSGHLQKEHEFFVNFVEGGRTVKEFCNQVRKKDNLERHLSAAFWRKLSLWEAHFCVIMLLSLRIPSLPA